MRTRTDRRDSADPGGAHEGRLAPVIPIRAGALEPDDGDRPIFAPIEEASLKALGRRSRSRREVEQLLARQGYPEHEISDELDRLAGVGLIDDFALAQRLVAQLQERKSLVGSAIKAELARRMIQPGAIDYAMDLIDTGDELAKARELAAVRARQYGSLDPSTVERRLTAWLMRRGYSGSTVRAAVQAAVADLRSS